MNVLVYRYGQIGDTIASIPSIRALRQHFREAQVTLVSEVPRAGGSLPPEQVLPAGLVDNYLKYPGGVSLRAVPALARFLWSLRRRRFDVLAYLAPTTRTAKRRQRDALFFKLAGIERTVGLRGFPNDPFPRAADGGLLDVQHEADALLTRLAADGIRVPAEGMAEIDLELTQEERRAAKSWLKQNLTSAAERGWFAISPGTKWPSKRWPVDRYFEVARKLWLEHGIAPVVVGGPEDRVQGDELVRACGAGASAAGELNVRQSAALMESATLYVGNDSGPMHLAASVGTPCVGVFSAQDWRGRWHPYGREHEVLRSEVPCAGCFSATCARELQCLTQISAADVYAACARVLKRRANREPNAGNLQRPVSVR